jgi:hypothetical protein
MSSAPHIYLTDADFSDLLNGHTINVMDEAGCEHIFGPNGIEFSVPELEALENGGELWLDDGHRVSYPD